MEKIKMLPPKDHDKCTPDHKLVLVTQADGTRYPMESCGKINFYLHLMKQKYGWQIETIGMYTRSNVETLLKDMEEQDARDKAIGELAKAAEEREAVSAEEG